MIVLRFELLTADAQKVRISRIREGPQQGICRLIVDHQHILRRTGKKRADKVRRCAEGDVSRGLDHKKVGSVRADLDHQITVQGDGARH